LSDNNGDFTKTGGTYNVGDGLNPESNNRYSNGKVSRVNNVRGIYKKEVGSMMTMTAN
jgi:hypothetical protein